MNGSITIKDIANELNLSATAVSRALRDMPDISEETKERVRMKASEMKYKKNFLACTLRTQKSHTIGFIMPDILNPVYSGMYKGVEAICKENGYTILFSTSNEKAADERQAINAMLNHQVEGIVMCPSLEDTSNIEKLKCTTLPFVLIGRTFKDDTIYSVISSDWMGGYSTCEYLLQKGYRSFLYLSAPLYLSPASDRRDGFLQCVYDNGLDRDLVEIYETDPSWPAAYQTMSKLLDNGFNKRAVFTFNDIMAMGVLKLLQERGISVPEQIAVIGYDNIDHCELMTPSLSTVDIYGYCQGYQGMILLHDLIQKKEVASDKRQILLTPRIITRHST